MIRVAIEGKKMNKKADIRGAGINEKLISGERK
jgi:hypothetical protein